MRTCFEGAQDFASGEHKTRIGGTHVHIGGALNCCGGVWACFELIFSLLALACQEAHAKLLLVYFFSQDQICNTEGTHMEYTDVFLYFMDNSIVESATCLEHKQKGELAL